MSTSYSETTRSFDARDLDNTAFRHADHVRIAYEMLKAHDFIEASARYAANIRHLAARAGAPDKYNVTITFAFMSLIAERMETTDHVDYKSFIAANSELTSKDVLQKWYSPARLLSDRARRVFLLPDAGG
jgi:hypothetical protein